SAGKEGWLVMVGFRRMHESWRITAMTVKPDCHMAVRGAARGAPSERNTRRLAFESMAYIRSTINSAGWHGLC
ncbi:MAG: hypothetical protein M3R60_05875, partial [Pseudomonadota bacterium]|nr:hypothetical protein [Pseudomonadota bacterium]